MIDGQGGTGPYWDGKTVPWPNYGQPPRIIRVTYKINRDQVLRQQAYHRRGYRSRTTRKRRSS